MLREVRGHLTGRAAYAVEIAVDVLGTARPRAIRETIVAKTLVGYAIRELDATGAKS